jgi:hypothetical protein
MRNRKPKLEQHAFFLPSDSVKVPSTIIPKARKQHFSYKPWPRESYATKRKMRNAMPDIKVECDQLHVR